MRKPRIFRTAAFLVFALLIFFATEPARAGSITYDVTVDTSSINGVVGNLDFQFNPGGPGALFATATVTNFAGGNPMGTSALTGDASGSLPGTLTLDNGTQLNEIFQGFTYGSSLSYDLTLSGPAVGGSGTDGSTFFFSLFDSTGTIPLLSANPNGSSVLNVYVNADGTTSFETFPSTPGGTSVASVTPAASATPEPSSLALMSVGLTTFGAWRWRRGKRANVALIS